MKIRSLVLAAVAGMFITTGASAAPILINGDFEDVTTLDPFGLVDTGQRLSELSGSGSGSWDVFDEIAGWRTVSGAGIEIQTNGTLGTIDSVSPGSRYVELDSHPTPNSNSTMAQDVVLDAGQYLLEFYYSPRNSDVGSNGISYEVNDGSTLLAGSVTGPSATTSVGVWTLISELFEIGADNTLVTIAFGATGSANTLGGFLDNIKITPVPLPAGLPLFIGGLGLMGWLGWRRKRVHG